MATSILARHVAIELSRLVGTFLTVLQGSVVEVESCGKVRRWPNSTRYPPSKEHIESLWEDSGRKADTSKTNIHILALSTNGRFSARNLILKVNVKE